MGLLKVCNFLAAALFLSLTTSTTADDNVTESFKLLNTMSSFKSCNQSGIYDICLTGSRMYQLLSYDVENSQILPDCILVCKDSYSEEAEKQACKDGCFAEVATVEQRQKELAQYAEDRESIMNRAVQQRMLSHWMFAMITGFDIFNGWYDSDPGVANVDDYATYLVVEESDDQLRISSYRVINRPFIATTATAESGPLNPYVDADDTEPCYIKGTYSRLVLCLLLFSSGMFLVWLTCSTVSTAPRQSVKDSEGTDVKDEKKALKMLLDNSLVSVHVPSKSLDDDDKMLLA